MSLDNIEDIMLRVAHVVIGVMPVTARLLHRRDILRTALETCNACFTGSWRCDEPSFTVSHDFEVISELPFFKEPEPSVLAIAIPRQRSNDLLFLSETPLLFFSRIV